VATRGIDIKDGQLVLACGLVASIVSVYGILRRWGMLGWAYLFFGLLCVTISGADLYVFWQRQYNAGPGLYLTLVGGLWLMLAPLLVLLGQLRG
jgi:hypothetical protein